MKRYPSYKASVVKWLGEIPIDWECKTLKRITKFAYGDSLSDENRKGGDVPVYGSNGVVGFHNKPITKAPCIIVGRKGSYGRVNFSEIPCYPIDTSYFIDSTKTSCNLVWLKYFLSILRLDENTLDDMVPGLSREWAYRMPGLIISLPEQNSIVHFLDHKTGQIDRFIANRQRQIELLREQKTGIINQTVTKGIDSMVILKDSGDIRLGKVPIRWEVMELKFAARMMRGKFSHRPRNDERLYGGEYPFIQTGDVTKTEKYITTYHQTLNEWGYSVSKMFPKGTVVITIAANIGDVAILDIDACFPDSVVGFFSKKNLTEYLFYLLKSMKEVFICESIEGTQLNLSVDRLSSIKVAMPDPKEQKKIVDFIVNETSTIDTLISKYHKQINLMQEYRTSLISQAVTGKIDVRGWQPKNRKLSMEQLPVAVTSEN